MQLRFLPLFGGNVLENPEKHKVISVFARKLLTKLAQTAILSILFLFSFP